jgi:hypothetical protein
MLAERRCAHNHGIDFFLVDHYKQNPSPLHSAYDHVLQNYYILFSLIYGLDK